MVNFFFAILGRENCPDLTYLKIIIFLLFQIPECMQFGQGSVFTLLADGQ